MDPLAKTQRGFGSFQRARQRDKRRDKAFANVTPFVTPKMPVFRSVTSVTRRDRNGFVTLKTKQKQHIRFLRDILGFFTLSREHPSVTKTPTPL